MKKLDYALGFLGDSPPIAPPTVRLNCADGTWSTARGDYDAHGAGYFASPFGRGGGVADGEGLQWSPPIAPPTVKLDCAKEILSTARVTLPRPVGEVVV